MPTKNHYQAVNYLYHLDIVLEQLKQIVNINTKTNYREIKKQLLVSVQSKYPREKDVNEARNSLHSLPLKTLCILYALMQGVKFIAPTANCELLLSSWRITHQSCNSSCPVIFAESLSGTRIRTLTRTRTVAIAADSGAVEGPRQSNHYDGFCVISFAVCKVLTFWLLGSF